MENKLITSILIISSVLASIGITFAVSLTTPTAGGLQFNNTTSHGGIAKFFRNQTILVYANWTENVTSDIALNITNSSTNVISIISNTTSGDILNQTYNSTWTNYTIAVNTSSVWALGPHNVTINVSNTTDSNVNSTSANFTLWGWAEVNGSAARSYVPTSNPPSVGNYSIRYNCTLRDNVTKNPIPNYLVNFYDANLLGNTTTGSDGKASYFPNNYPSPDTREIICNITHNSTLYYNASSNNYEKFNVTFWGAVWSSSGEFAASNVTLNLNWTNNNQQNISLAVSTNSGKSAKINIDNLTTRISGNYSQETFYAVSGSKYYGDTESGKCFVQDSSYNNPLLVKNSTGSAKNTTLLMNSGDQKNYTIIHNVVCPPGRYWGTLELRNATNHTEALNITAEINVPISTENELVNTTGVGFFNGTMPVNASTYHSYYFNTSNSTVVPSIPNTTGIRIELNNLARDLDLFLLDESGNLKAKSINKQTNSESLIYNYLPQGEMWEIRVYGNHTQLTNYGGVIHFTTLNATNTSDNSTLTNIDFGDLWPGNEIRVNVTLKNEGSLNFTDVQETSELYQRDVFAGSSAPKNFTFLVPSSAQKVRALINWTGASDYNISLYKPDGSIVNYSSQKRDIANVTGVEQEEWVETTDVSSTDKGFWKVRITNATNVSFDSYNVTTKVWFNVSEWIKTNYTVQNFTELGMSNDSQSYYFNLTVQNNSLSGKYKGWLKYQSDSGAALKVPLEFNLTAPELVVNGSIEEGSVQIVDNIGFNRTGTNKRQITVKINNTGNKNLTFESNASSSFLNYSSNYMEFNFNHPNYVNPGNYENLTINITINTAKTGDTTGIYKGWILLNDTSAQPSNTFNLTVEVNLTRDLDITWTSDGVDGLKTADGDDNWIENISRDENITLFTNVKFKNGSSVGNVLKWNNFSAWITERNTSHNVSSGINIYNDSTDDIWDAGKYDPNVSIPVSSQSIPGGYYKVYLKADHYIHGVHLYGTGVHNHLVINDTGLSLSALTTTDKTLNEGGNVYYFNVSVVNYGPVEATDKLYMENWTHATVESYAMNHTDCGSVDSNTNHFTIAVNGNATEACKFSWKITSASDVSSDKSKDLTVYPSDSNFGNVTLSLTINHVSTTTTTGGDSGTTTTTQTTTTVPPEELTISVSLEPEKLEVMQGNSSKVKVKVNNTGNETLNNLKLNLSGIPSTWFSTSPSEIDDLDEDEELDFEVNISPAKNATIKEYTVKYKVSNSNVSKTVKGTLKVLPSPEKYSEINQTYQTYLNNYTETKEEMLILKTQGKNISKLNQTLVSLEAKLDKINSSISKGDYYNASVYLEDAKSLIKDAANEITKLKGKKQPIPPYLWIIAGVAIIFVVAFLIYLLLPPKKGYHPERGFVYKPPKKQSTIDKMRHSLRMFIQTLRKKLGLKVKQKYNYQRREKWKEKSEE